MDFAKHYAISPMHLEN